MVPQDVIEDILRRVSIVSLMSQYMVLKKSGQHSYKGLCLFHNDKKNPSLSVNDQKGLYHCFSCGAGGNALTFLKEYNKLDFVESLKTLGTMAGIDIEPYLTNQHDLLPLRNKLKTMHQIAQEFFVAQLYQIDNPQTEQAIRILRQRKLDKKTVEIFGIGFGGVLWDGLFKHLQAEGFKSDEIFLSGLCGQNEKGQIYDRFRNRITFPLYDSEGLIVAYGGRIIDQSSPAKYVNSPETPLFKKGSFLYGWHLAKERALEVGSVILVEGYLDVIRMFQAGFTTAVAPLGTGLTEDRISYLKNKIDHLVLCFDGDQAGRKSAYRSAGIAAKLGVSTQIAMLPENEDPDTYLLNYGPDAMASIIDQSIDAEIFILESAQQKLPDSNLFIREVFEYAVFLEGSGNSPSFSLQTEQFLKKIAEILRVSYSTIELEFSRFKAQFVRFPEQGFVVSEVKNKLQNDDEYELVAVLIMFPHFIDVAASFTGPDDFVELEAQEAFRQLLLHPEIPAQEWIIKMGHCSFISKTSQWVEPPDIRIIKNYAVALRIKSLKRKRDFINTQSINCSQSSPQYESYQQEILHIQSEMITLKREFYHL